MATGTGKTVVIAMLIAWQTLNKVANPQDGRFKDAFLVVCPGITIRDRLRVVLPTDPSNYYDARDLIPPELKDGLGRAKIVITNFHALKPKEKGNVSKVAKQLLERSGGNAGVFTETPNQMVNRVLRELGGNKKNIVVINDEAHHCYRRKPDETDEDIKNLKGDEKKEANKRDSEARVWLSGLEAIAAKIGVSTVYDLSATPFFLRGSGYPEGTLFPWVVSDFSLIDAIESGIVKIPRVPVDDDAASTDLLPTYRNLWVRIRDDLPKKGRNIKDAAIEPHLPGELEGALRSLYSNYVKSYKHWKKNATDHSTAVPPVFIVVANNTTVSKMIYDWVAGWPKPQPDGTVVEVPGELELFSNVENGRRLARPRTLLIDSTQLESGETMTAGFKRAAADEIERFKADYLQRFPGRNTDKLTDEQLLREVMNTVGKPGLLGEQIRCVVSVSMLTEGWDANTVTHILGVRAFGTQLLCEQVVGRGLRRLSYAIDENTGHFTPEYAEVYGVPFSFIPASGATGDPSPPMPTTHVRALDGRIDCEITFPIVTGYRWEIPDENLDAEFGDESKIILGADNIPTMTEVSGSVGEIEIHILEDLMKLRVQEIAFELTNRLLKQYFKERPWLFPQILRIVQQWISDPTMIILRDNAFVQLLGLTGRTSEAVEKIYHGIVKSDNASKTLRPVLRAWDPVGSTQYVEFDTVRPCWPTSADKCHVSHVAADTESWEQRMAQALEEMPEVVRYVKNQSLGFTIPYKLDHKWHRYFPDFIACIDDGNGSDDLLHLIVEVTGKSDKAKKAKTATARDFWIPAVNNHGGFGRWQFVEVTDPWDSQATIRAVVNDTIALATTLATSGGSQ